MCIDDLSCLLVWIVALSITVQVRFERVINRFQQAMHSSCRCSAARGPRDASAWRSRAHEGHRSCTDRADYAHPRMRKFPRKGRTDGGEKKGPVLLISVSLISVFLISLSTVPLITLFQKVISPFLGTEDWQSDRTGRGPLLPRDRRASFPPLGGVRSRTHGESDP